MKVKIKLSHFRALSLARAGKKEMRWFLQGIWLDFAKNRVMATNSHLMMVTLPNYGMVIETAPTQHAYLNIPAAAVEQFLKISGKHADFLIIESENETDAVITDGTVRVYFTFDKSEMPNIDAVIKMDCSCESTGGNFFGNSFAARFLQKAGKAAVILNKDLPQLRFYPSLFKNELPTANIIINEEVLMVVIPMATSNEPPSLNWEQQAA